MWYLRNRNWLSGYQSQISNKTHKQWQTETVLLCSLFIYKCQDVHKLRYKDNKERKT